MHPDQVFISYRRDDAAGYARAVYDELAQHLGAERVFIDVDDINAGQPFSEIIERAIDASQVMLVLIGRRWRGERDGGPPRIDEPDDLVRQEVAAGLAKGKRVIPLLLDGAAMPTAASLPDGLRALAGRNALELDNTRFATDIDHLIAVLRDALAETTATTVAPPTRRYALWALGAIVLAAGTTAALWELRGSSRSNRPAVVGTWRADVTYDWPNAHYTERFVFDGDAAELHGSVSFLGVARGVQEGRVEPDGLRFVTRTTEAVGAGTLEVVHRYRGRLAGDEIRFVMQTEGGESPHAPVEFVARRVLPAASGPDR